VSINIKFRQCVNRTPSRAPRAKAKLTKDVKKVYGMTEREEREEREKQGLCL